MKNTIRVFAAAAALMVAVPAFAQGGGGGGGGGMSQADRMAARRAAMFEGITLTDAQKVQIDTIFAQTQKAQADLRAANQGADRQALMGKMQEINAKQTESIKKVLTAEQFATYEKNMANMPQGRGRGGR